MRNGTTSTRTRTSKRGYIWAEVVVCIPIVGLLIALTAAGFTQYYRFRSESIGHQAAAWVAAGQLQRYQAGAPLDSIPPPGVLPPEVTLKTSAKPGQGPWEGFQLVTVTATFALGEKHTVRERISGYVRSEVKP